MRLWHIDLIPFLPRQQLIAQWRECVCIAKNLALKGTPNHVLVNRILEYSAGHFQAYGRYVTDEMKKRGYKISANSSFRFNQYVTTWALSRGNNKFHTQGLFSHWHNRRYLDQCYFNLQEKHDCGAITDDEWQKLEEGYRKASEENA